MAAVIRRAGHTLRIVENNPESVTATLIRADDKKFEFTVTWDKDKPLTPAQASVAKGLETLNFTQAAYTDLCKRCLGQIVAVPALNDEQASTLHTELLAIYNSNHAQPAAEPATEAEVEIIDDQQAPIFDYGDDPNGGAA